MVEQDAGALVLVARGAQGLNGPSTKPPGKGRKKRRSKATKRGQQQKAKVKDDDENPSADPTTPATPGRKVPPLVKFLPSPVRRELLQRSHSSPPPSLPRRRGDTLDHVRQAMQQVRRLQCPLVWGLTPLSTSASSLYTILDSTPHRGTTWHTAVELIQVACDFAGMGVSMLWKSRELLEEVYALLKEGRRGRGKEAKLLRKYDAGLKHVLDATWLLLRDDADARADRPLPDGTALTDVVFYEELDDKQQASVHAIKAIMSGVDLAAAEQALRLDPSEGQWHYVKWLVMRAARARRRGQPPSKLEQTAAEVEVLRRAYALRKTPQTVLAMARTALEGPTKDPGRCAELMSEAAELFPLSAYVHFHSGHLYQCLGRGKRDACKVAVCFKMAIHLAQGTWMKASLDWGMYCMKNGMQREGFIHLVKGGAFDSD